MPLEMMHAALERGPYSWDQLLCVGVLVAVLAFPVGYLMEWWERGHPRR